MKNLLLIIIFAIGFTACDQAVKGRNDVVYKSAGQYNDYIVGRQTILMKNLVSFGEVAQTNLDSAYNMLDKFILDIEDKIASIKGMPPFKGDSSLRDAAISSFEFYKKISGNEYKQIINIRNNGGDSTEDGIAELKRIVDQMTLEEEKFDKRFHNAQKDFADKNNMKLGENEMQKKIDKMKE